MKAMILAAGFGTRLKPWTDKHPKALVPVNGVPMLERVITRLRDNGFDYIVVNVCHFADQIVDFLRNRDLGVRIAISDESSGILDTGGGIAAASELLMADDKEPFLVHNVDILSDAPLDEIVQSIGETDVSLLTSSRESSRKLVFDTSGRLKAWHNLATGEIRPANASIGPEDKERAFAGIYAMNAKALDSLIRFSTSGAGPRFPIMDYFLSLPEGVKIREFYAPRLKMIDIGKPETLARAADFLS